MSESPSKADQYVRHAEEWSERQYADHDAYFTHKADLTISLGPKLAPGDEVLELGCADGGFGEEFLKRGLRYRGVDVTEAMVREAARRLGSRASVEVGDMLSYVPPNAVAATVVFRAIKYAPDHGAFFRHVAQFTEKKLVFDVNPREFPIDGVVTDLRAAGFERIVLRPFFVPTTVALPRLIGRLARALERSGPLARLALRVRFTYLVAASREV